MRTSAQSYLNAVQSALIEQDVSVDVVTVDNGEVRSGELQVAPESFETVFTEAASLCVRWDEVNGWAYAARYGEHTGLGESWVYLGFGLTPTPAEVARWIETVLINPSLVTSNEEGPYRSAGDPAPELEAALRSYEPADRS